LREKKKKGKVKETVAESDEDGNRKISPREDYQVHQAINYLKNVGLIKSLKF